MLNLTNLCKSIELSSFKYNELMNNYKLMNIDNNKDHLLIEENKVKIVSLFRSLNELFKDVEVRLVSNINKFIEKINFTDPITNIPRYGEKTKIKILDSKDQIDNLKLSIEQLYSHIQEIIVIHTICIDEQQEANNLFNIPLPNKLLSIDDKFQYKKDILSVIDTKKEISINHNNINEINLNMNDLEVKAKEIRERKQKDNEIILESYYKLYYKLIEITKYLNNYQYDLKIKYPNENSLKVILSQLLSEITASTINIEFKLLKKKQIQIILQTIYDLLCNIISKPDQINIRKLRITNPKLKQNVTSITMGIELLLLIGFQVNIIDTLLDKDPTNISLKSSLEINDSNNYNDIIYKYNLIPMTDKMNYLLQYSNNAANNNNSTTTTINNDNNNNNNSNVYSNHPLPNTLDIFDLLAPHSPYDIYLEMYEPMVDLLITPLTTTSINSSNSSKDIKMSWIEWYDQLQLNKDIIENTLKTIKSI